MINYFKNKARTNALRAAKQKVNRKMGFSSFDSIKNVAVIMPYKLDVENTASNKLLKFFKDKGIQVQMLVHYPEKKLPANTPTNGSMLLFAEGDTNWYGKPTKKEIDDFANTSFGLLIDLSSQHIFSLQYIVEASQALFKVGRISYPNDPYDFVLTGDANNDSKYVDDLFAYLAKFK